jgi:hypothetical protein
MAAAVGTAAASAPHTITAYQSMTANAVADACTFDYF